MCAHTLACSLSAPRHNMIGFFVCFLVQGKHCVLEGNQTVVWPLDCASLSFIKSPFPASTGDASTGFYVFTLITLLGIGLGVHGASFTEHT